MLKEFDLEPVVWPLLEWFENNARKLPWREEVTPYKVWVSEIMLQQTRVEAVKPYFARFMETLPDIQALAECEEETLLKLWEGLGYYNRVRNMQIAARQVMQEYQGNLPADYQKLLELKGIGSYTAGAIASIAFGIPVPAVDGNVLRVITRVSADTNDIMKQSFKTEVEKRLTEVIPAHRAGAFNQALMELGALVCVPNGAPFCTDCPWQEICLAYKEDNISKIPVKTKKKPRKIEEKTVFIIRADHHIILNKRENKGLLAGLYEFPNVEGTLTKEEVLSWTAQKNLTPIRILPLAPSKHIFSHVEWHMNAYLIFIDELEEDKSGMLYVDVEDARNYYPIPSAFHAYTEYVNQMLPIEK